MRCFFFFRRGEGPPLEAALRILSMALVVDAWAALLSSSEFRSLAAC